MESWIDALKMDDIFGRRDQRTYIKRAEEDTVSQVSETFPKYKEGEHK